MTRMTWHPALRADLVEALRAVPPDAPTLCDGWQARHLAAHVVLRERSVRVGLGLAAARVTDVADRAVDELAATAADEAGYAALVDRVEAGPPRWHPTALAGDAANLTELYVHGEDVRRGDGTPRERPLEPGLVEALWRDAARFARLRTSRVPVGLVLVRPDGPRTHVRRPRGDHGTVVVRGAAGELVLWLAGRGVATTLVVQGEDADVAALAARLPLP